MFGKISFIVVLVLLSLSFMVNGQDCNGDVCRTRVPIPAPSTPPAPSLQEDPIQEESNDDDDGDDGGKGGGGKGDADEDDEDDEDDEGDSDGKDEDSDDGKEEGDGDGSGGGRPGNGIGGGGGGNGGWPGFAVILTCLRNNCLVRNTRAPVAAPVTAPTLPPVAAATSTPTAPPVAAATSSPTLSPTICGESVSNTIVMDAEESVDAGVIPAGSQDVTILWVGTPDSDLQLYDGTTLVVGFNGLVSSPGEVNFSYESMDMFYSGYESNAGTETIIIDGTTTIDLTVAGFAFAVAGNGTATWTFSTPGNC